MSSNDLSSVLMVLGMMRMVSSVISSPLGLAVRASFDTVVGRGHGNLSNVFRVKVSIKSGRCELPDGTQVDQVGPSASNLRSDPTAIGPKVEGKAHNTLDCEIFSRHRQ